MRFILALFFFSVSLHAEDISRWFVDTQGRPTAALKELLELDGLYDPHDTLPDIVTKTQKSWKQVQHGNTGKELGDLIDTQEQQKIRSRVIECAHRLGLFRASAPTHTHYTYALCPGAFLEGVRFRLKALITAWNRGVRFDTLVFLTGERHLRKEKGQKDDRAHLLDQTILPFKQNWKLPEDAAYETEHDMVRLVWEQTALPEDMAKALEGKVVFVNARCPSGQERISTKDAYSTWLAEFHPEPGYMLIASHPLYWTFQQLGFRTLMPKGFEGDMLAGEFSEHFMEQNRDRIVSLIQDTVAKCLFECNKLVYQSESTLRP